VKENEDDENEVDDGDGDEEEDADDDKWRVFFTNRLNGRCQGE
jgi:hypothetical protein